MILTFNNNCDINHVGALRVDGLACVDAGILSIQFSYVQNGSLGDNSLYTCKRKRCVSLLFMGSQLNSGWHRWAAPDWRGSPYACELSRQQLLCLLAHSYFNNLAATRLRHWYNYLEQISNTWAASQGSNKDDDDNVDVKHWIKSRAVRSRNWGQKTSGWIFGWKWQKFSKRFLKLKSSHVKLKEKTECSARWPARAIPISWAIVVSV